MKKRLFSLIAFSGIIISMLLSSCSGNSTADTRELLATIPSDVSFVAVANLKAVIEDAGAKVDGSTVKIDKDLAAKIAAADSTAFLPRFISYVADGGVDPSVAAVFREGYNTFAAGFLADTDKFKELVEKEFGGKFTADGDIATCGNVAVSGNRFWVCVTSRNTINPSDIKHFTSLSEKQSIISNKNADTALSDMDHDIQAWGDIKGVLNAAGLDFGSKAAATMALETIFDDAESMAWTADFEKGKFVATGMVMNSKGGLAKFNFPTSEIDQSVIRKIEGNKNSVLAVAIPSKLIKALEEQTKSKGASMIGMLLPMLSSLDGTCVYTEDADKSASAIISTNGGGTAELSDLLNQYGYTVKKDGKLLLCSKKGEGTANPAETPSVNADEAAKLLKGGMLGVIYCLSDMPAVNAHNLSNTVLLLSPEKNSLSISFSLISATPKDNIILNLL